MTRLSIQPRTRRAQSSLNAAVKRQAPPRNGDSATETPAKGSSRFPTVQSPSPSSGDDSSRTIRSLAGSLLTWFAANARDLPWRRTLDPYGIWISEIMLQQTQVKTVIPYWTRWMQELPDACALAKAKLDRVLKLWEGLGYYTRARNLQKAALQIVHEHCGVFPATFEAVLALPGIGRYTAGAITSIAFNQPSPILDGNVIRVLTRLFGIADDPRGKITNARLWELATQFVRAAERVPDSKLETRNPKLLLSGSCSALNQSLMELGALICTPRQPQCFQCPVRRHCVAYATQRVDELPNLAKRAAAIPRRFIAFAVEHEGRWLVRQRPADVVNAHLWEFPNIEVATDSTLPVESVAASAMGYRGARWKALGSLTTVKHSITRFRISLEVHRAESSVALPPRIGDRWLDLAELNELPFTSAHRKALNVLQRS